MSQSKDAKPFSPEEMDALTKKVQDERAANPSAKEPNPKWKDPLFFDDNGKPFAPSVQPQEISDLDQPGSKE